MEKIFNTLRAIRKVAALIRNIQCISYNTFTMLSAKNYNDKGEFTKLMYKILKTVVVVAVEAVLCFSRQSHSVYCS